MLLKTENEVFNLNNKRCFLIKAEDIIVFLRNYQRKLFDDFGVVCESKNNCLAHEAYSYLKIFKR